MLYSSQPEEVEKVMQIISIAHTSPEGIKHQQIRPTIEVTQWSKDNVGYDEAAWEGPQLSLIHI